MPTQETKKGDIVINKLHNNKQFEIKAFISLGPSSFAPKENWDWLYFVDTTNTLNYTFKVYEIKLSNKSSNFRNISK